MRCVRVHVCYMLKLNASAILENTQNRTHKQHCKGTKQESILYRRKKRNQESGAKSKNKTTLKKKQAPSKIRLTGGAEVD